jgi:hypothetical protein
LAVGNALTGLPLESQPLLCFPSPRFAADRASGALTSLFTLVCRSHSQVLQDVADDFVENVRRAHSVITRIRPTPRTSTYKLYEH